MNELVQKRVDLLSDERLQVEMYKKEIVGLFSDYRNPWDILSELIQNSVDAINQSSVEEGRIEISISKRHRKLIVKDNGCGIDRKNIETVITPGKSIDKNPNLTYGYKGVGLSFLSHLSKRFEIESLKDGKKNSYIIENAIDWIFDRVDDINTIFPNEIEEVGQNYTQVALTLDGKYSDCSRVLQVLDSFFDWVTDIKILEYVLRTKTAIGNTNKYFDTKKSKEIVTTVHILDESPVVKEIEYSLLTPFETQAAKLGRFYVDKTIDTRKRYSEIFTDPLIRDSQRGFRCLRHDFLEEEVGTYNKFGIQVSILICGETGTTQLEKQFDVDKIDSYDFSPTTGIHLSINGMPTGILLEKWSSGFDRRFYIVVNVSMEINGELDKGRKGISRHTRKLIVDKVDELLKLNIVEDRHSLRKMARKLRIPGTTGFGGTDTAETIEKWDALDPLHPLIFGIRKQPDDENAVIALFFELMGRDLLRGYEFRYISQDATFDFAFNYKMPEDDYLIANTHTPTVQFVADNQGDRINENRLLKNDRGELYHVGEFKIRVEDIIDNDKQSLANFELLVAW